MIDFFLQKPCWDLLHYYWKYESGIFNNLKVGDFREFCITIFFYLKITLIRTSSAISLTLHGRFQIWNNTVWTIALDMFLCPCQSMLILVAVVISCFCFRFITVLVLVSVTYFFSSENSLYWLLFSKF